MLLIFKIWGLTFKIKFCDFVCATNKFCEIKWHDQRSQKLLTQIPVIRCPFLFVFSRGNRILLNELNCLSKTFIKNVSFFLLTYCWAKVLTLDLYTSAFDVMLDQSFIYSSKSSRHLLLVLPHWPFFGTYQLIVKAYLCGRTHAL